MATASTSYLRFVSLELEDFLQFGGRQTVTFAQPADDGRCGLTLATGDGGSGKTHLVNALCLALWGAWEFQFSNPFYFRGGGSGDGSLEELQRFINVDALREGRAVGRVRLTIHVGDERSTAPYGAHIERCWHPAKDGGIAERLWVTRLGWGGTTAGRGFRLGGPAAREEAATLLPRDTLPPIFSSPQELESLGRLLMLASSDRIVCQHLRTRFRHYCLKSWPAAEPAVVELGNRLLRCCREEQDSATQQDAEVWLLPESAGRRWPGARRLFQGVWLTRSPIARTQLSCVGAAFMLGLHLAAGTCAPLVLDAPANDLPPAAMTVFLEALADLAKSQVVILAHQCQVDELALSLWGRVRRVYLVERRGWPHTAVLHEPAASEQ